MRASAYLVAILSVFSSAVMAQSPEPPFVLSVAQREHLKVEVLTPVRHVNDLSPSVREGLSVLFQERAFVMAEPGADFQATDDVDIPGLPFRRLIVAACSLDHCLIHYERGGIVHGYRVVLLTLTKEAARFEWGGRIRHGVSDLAVLRKQVLNGAVGSRISLW